MADPVSDAARIIDDWERNATEKAARFKLMAEQVEQVSITESVANGAVIVTVGHNGLPTNVAMTDAVRTMEPDQIAAHVMAAIRKAQSRYPERLAEILADTVGEDDPATRHILAKASESFPAPPDEDLTPDEERMVFSDVEPTEQPPPPRPAPRRSGVERRFDD
jgi:DNA-binding protein YbaB